MAERKIDKSFAYYEPNEMLKLYGEPAENFYKNLHYFITRTLSKDTTFSTANIYPSTRGEHNHYLVAL